MKEEARDGLERSLALLGVDHYRLRIFERGDKDYEPLDEGEKAAFHIQVKNPYRDIKFFIHEKAYEVPREDLEIYWLHEALHVVFWDIHTLAENRYATEEQISGEMENLCDRFAILLKKLK